MDWCFGVFPLHSILFKTILGTRMHLSAAEDSIWSRTDKDSRKMIEKKGLMMSYANLCDVMMCFPTKTNQNQ